MAPIDQPALSNDVRTALLCLARLSASPDLGLDCRIAVALSRDVLLDIRRSEPTVGAPVLARDVSQILRTTIRCLRREVRCRGLAAWRSRAALDLLRSAGVNVHS